MLCLSNYWHFCLVGLHTDVTCMRWPHSINTLCLSYFCAYLFKFFYLWFWIVGIFLNIGMCVFVADSLFFTLHEWEMCGLLCHKENKNEMKMINYARNVDIRIEPFVLSPCKNCCLHSMHMICTFSVAIKLHNEEVLWTFFSPIYDECIIFWKYRHNLC